jgi:hypothetical protein
MKTPVLRSTRLFAIVLSGVLLHAPLDAAGGCDSPMFAGARLFAAANDSSFVATGDFNHDGFTDLAVVDSAANNVSILLGNGDSTFQPAVNSAAGRNPTQVLVADFNGDGKPDLAIAASQTVLIMLGNGDGTFQPAISTSSSSTHMAVGDLNGDGKPDLVVDSYPVSILLGKGDGTFQSPISAAQGANLALANGITVGDFNGDGKLDVVTGDFTGGIDVMLGDGKGNLAAAVNFSTGSSPSQVTVGDFNGDHKLDVVALSNLNNNVTVLLGNGDATFQAPTTYTVGTQPTFVVVADLNGDGNLDMAVTNLSGQQGGNGTISVFSGDGDGTFQPAVQYNPTGQVNWALAVGDFNGDGLPDLVFASRVLNIPTQVGVMLGNPNGTFQSPASYAVGAIPRSPVLADLNGDGVLDMVVADAGMSNNISVLLGKGDGTFQPAVSYPTAFGASSVAVGDLNGDGRPDLVVANGSAGNVLVFLGNGDGTFQSPLASGFVFGAAVVVVGDFNGDGKLDVIALNSSGFATLLGKGDGTFSAMILNNLGLQLGNRAAVVADLNGDGKPDLALTSSAPTNPSVTGVAVLLGKGDGTFQSPVNYTIGANAQSIAVGDLNGDGKPDLAVADLGATSLSDQLGMNPGSALAVLLGNGDGSFQAAVRYSMIKGSNSVAMGDFNGDGKTDLAVLGANSTSVVGVATVLLGNGDGTFRNALNYGAGSNALALAVGDLNGDGKADMVIADDLANSVLVLLNTYTPGSGAALCSPVQPLGN